MVAMPAFIAACGLASANGSPSQVIVALVGPVHAGQHLDQRGLAGAVLAEQAVHLAGARPPAATPSSARTPGNVLTTSVELAARRRRRVAHDGCSKAMSLASTAAPTTPARGAQLGEHDRQVARSPAAASGGRPRCGSRRAGCGPSCGQPAPDDDHRRVDEADQGGEHAADPAAAVADQPDAGDVALGGAVGDVPGGDLAVGRPAARPAPASRRCGPRRARRGPAPRR